MDAFSILKKGSPVNSIFLFPLNDNEMKVYREQHLVYISLFLKSVSLQILWEGRPAGRCQRNSGGGRAEALIYNATCCT